MIVSDIAPAREGYELVRKLRSLAPASNGLTPALALSAFGRTTDNDEATLAGFQGGLAEPWTSRELVAIVRGLAEKGPLAMAR